MRRFAFLLCLLVASTAMALQKNVASQKVLLYAYDKTTGAAAVEDPTTWTIMVSVDGAAAAAAVNDGTSAAVTNQSGMHVLVLDQAETNGSVVSITATTATANILIEPVIIETDAGTYARTMLALPAVAPEAAGGLPTGNASNQVSALLANGAHGGAAATFQFASGTSGVITGNLSGSVGSVTGAVGSVTGNVGGNVAGSVASVTGNVTFANTSIATAGTVTDGAKSATALSSAVLTPTRIGYLDKLNVTGVLAHTDNAASFKATGFSTHSAADVVTSLQGVGTHLTLVKAVTDKLDTTLILDGAVWDFTAAALAASPAGAGGGSATVENQVSILSSVEIIKKIVQGGR